MKAGEYDLEIYQGSTYTKSFVVGAGIDLDTYQSVRMSIRIKPQFEGTVYDSATDGGLTKTGQTITLTIPATLTAGFDFDEAGYDIELVKTNVTPNVVDKILTGKVNLIKEYTK